MNADKKNHNDLVKEFNKNGYIIQRGIYSEGDFEELFLAFYDLALSCAKRNSIGIDFDYFPSLAKASYQEDLKMLDKLLLILLKANKSFIGEIYDAFSYSSTFLRFISKKKVEEIAQILLGLKKNTTLYGWTNRVRIDPPGDNRRTYGWHQEVFYTQPRYYYLQTWAPVLRDTTFKNGTIWIKEASHKEGIAKQTWNEIEGRATQIIIDKEILDKYESKNLEMKKGDVLFFNGYLAHSSGINTTNNEIRYSLVGMWNDTSNQDFRAPIPNFISRTESAKEYFIEKFGKSRIKEKKS